MLTATEQVEIRSARAGLPVDWSLRMSKLQAGVTAVEEIHENFPSVPVSTIKQLIEFVQVDRN